MQFVLICSDPSHRSVHGGSLLARCSRNQKERYSHDLVDEYIRVRLRGLGIAEDKQSAVWCCILIDAPATAGSGGEGGEEEEDETENRGGG